MKKRKINLMKVAFGATLVGVTTLAIKKMYQVARPKVSVNIAKDPYAERFSHDYEKDCLGTLQQPKGLNMAPDSCFVENQNVQSQTNSQENGPTLRRVPSFNFVDEESNI